MSIALLVTDPKNNDQGLYVPIATQQVFLDVWFPRCRALGLRFVPLFATGTNVEKEDIDFIVDELLKLRTSLVFGTTDELERHVAARVETLVSELTKAKEYVDCDIWIG